MMRYLFLLVSLIGALGLFLPNHLREVLYFNIELTRAGEYWRFVTGHLTYVSWQHWALNTASIALLVIWFDKRFQITTWISAILFILNIVSSGLYFFSQALVWYAGFSGILTGLYAFAAVITLRQSNASIALLVLLCMYVAWQLAQGELIDGSLETVSTSSYAHAFGLLGGILFALALLILKRNKKIVNDL